MNAIEYAEYQREKEMEKLRNERMVMGAASLKSDGNGPFYEGKDSDGYHYAAKYAPNSAHCADGGATYRIRYNPDTGHVVEKRRAAKGDGRGGSYSSSFIGTVKEWEPPVERWIK